MYPFSFLFIINEFTPRGKSKHPYLKLRIDLQSSSQYLENVPCNIKSTSSLIKLSRTLHFQTHIKTTNFQSCRLWLTYFSEWRWDVSENLPEIYNCGEIPRGLQANQDQWTSRAIIIKNHRTGKATQVFSAEKLAIGGAFSRFGYKNFNSSAFREFLMILR